ncbi:MAG: VTT domain-containing protein [archaeon GBS-70-058]|nr:VTT domain-containing protein [Candidatus Culexarchaeum nevadense]
MFEWLTDVMMKIALNYGYIGALVVSILGNFLPFIPIPYLIAIYYMASYMPVDPIILGIAAGIGGAIGKSVIYLLGFEGGKIIITEGKRRQIEKFKEMLGKYGAIAVFFVTVTPSPDDIVIIPLGLVRYSFIKFFIATALGKILLSIAVASFGRYFTEQLNIVFGEGSIYGILISVIVLLIMTWIIVKINWIKVAEIMDTSGLRGLIGIIVKGRWRELLSSNENG